MLKSVDDSRPSSSTIFKSISTHEDLTELFNGFKGAYPLKSFPHLRHLESESMFNKKKYSDFSYLEHDKEPIQHSMFKLSTAYVGAKARSKAMKLEAKEIFKSILGFMKDRFHPYPITLAHEVVFRGLEEPLLRDEILIQLIKQTTNNPKTESLLLGWKLVYLCVKTFPPTTEEMENVLMTHISEVANPKLIKYMPFDSVENVATNCYIALKNTIKNGAQSEAPNLLEIRKLAESQTQKLKIRVPSGDSIEIQIASVNRDMSVGGACQILGARLGKSKQKAELQIQVENRNLMKTGKTRVVMLDSF